MDELISRQAAIDAIAKMMPKSYTPDGSHPADEEIFRAQEIFADCIKTIEILPSAQPVIIRCKDCKYWDTTWTNDFSPNYHYCPMVDGVRKEDWFCADAERRTE